MDLPKHLLRTVRGANVSGWNKLVRCLSQVAAILMSKLVLEPETHFGIARAGAIPSLVCCCTYTNLVMSVLHTALLQIDIFPAIPTCVCLSNGRGRAGYAHRDGSMTGTIAVTWSEQLANCAAFGERR